MGTRTRIRRSMRRGVAAAGVLLLAALPGWAQEAEPGGLVVDKVVDANGDGVFADLEDAPASGAASFRVTLTNTTDGPLEVTSVVDHVGGAVLDVLAMPECEGLATTLAPAGSTVCTFTIDRYLHTYASQPRRELTNRVEAAATDGQESFAGADEATVRNPNADSVSVEVTLTTDADGDGAFSADEQAPAPGGDVPVLVEVRNTSPGSVVLTSLTGSWAGADPVDLFAVCPDLDGMRLWGVGEGHGSDGGHEDEEGHEDDGHGERPTSATCATTLVGHAPTAGTEVVDRVTATLAKRHSPEQSATASAEARVWVAATLVPGLDVELRVGPVGGPLGDHDEAPGPSIPVSGRDGVVALQVEVHNTGEVPLDDLVVTVPGVDLGRCVLPAVLAIDATVTCDVDAVPAESGPQVLEVVATASGAGADVQAIDAAHYLGVAATAPEQDLEPLPVPAPTPTDPAPAVTVPPVATAPGSTTTVAAPETLPRTGPPVGMLATGVASLLGGLVLLGVGRRRAR